MFLLHVTSAYPESAGNFAATRARAALQAGEVPGFSYAADPAAAHGILFFEHHPGHDPFFLAVLRHPLVRRFPQKCLLSHDQDFVAPFLPGLYCSLLRRDHRTGVTESWIYLNQQCPNPALRYVPPTGDEPLLFSFVGAGRTHPVRREILRLAAPDALLVDTSGSDAWTIPDADRAAYHERFARTLADSRFVLCPRGLGPNSYRVYEAMQTGRVPVIIADDFVPPAALPWDRFALFVPEAEVASLPARLAATAPRAAALGRAARQAWETWCAWPAGFAGFCAELPRFLAAGRPRVRPLRRALALVATSPGHARLFARSLRRRLHR